MSGFAEGTPTVTVRLGGKDYTLGFTIGAMRRAKELGVSQVDLSDGSALMLAMPQYVWACMTKEDRASLSPDEIDELVNPSNISNISEAIGELFKASLPEESTSGNGQPAATKKKEPTAGRSTSTSSGQLASTISG
jgi:hypothetical protein